jgi:transposase
MTIRRHELTDAEWERLAPLLPPERPQVGRPNKEHRGIINGILWKLRTGAPWRDLPERYGPWETVATRFRRWRLAGVWDRVLAAVQAAGDADGQLDWSVHFMDGTVIRAHQHAAGAKGGTQRRRRSGGARVGSARKCICGRKVVGSR